MQRVQTKQLWILLIIYFIYLIILTQSNFEYSVYWLKHLIDFGKRHFVNFLFYFEIHDVIGNILLFIPFGVLVFCIRHNDTRSEKDTLWTPFLLGVMVSCVIEAGQFFLDRSSSILDILFNGGGTVIGYRIMEVIRGKRRQPCRLPGKVRGFMLRYTLFIIYLVGFTYAVFLPVRVNKLDHWDNEYPVILGNEVGGGRPWHGTLYQCAIYSKALRHNDIKWLHQLGSTMKSHEIRQIFGLLAYYPMSEGKGDTLYDASGYGETLNLVGRKIKWAETGVYLEGAQPVTSRLPADKIIDILKLTSSFSVEVWCRSEGLDQFGPARIAGISGDTAHRCFTLVQQGPECHLRVNTKQGGINGSRIRVRAANVFRDSSLHHIVATFHCGVEKIFVDGRLRSAIQGNIDYLPDLFGMGRYWPGKIAFGLFMFIPLGILLATFFRRAPVWIALAFAGAMAFFIEYIYAVYYGQAVMWVFSCLMLGGTGAGAVAVKLWNRFSMSENQGDGSV